MNTPLIDEQLIERELGSDILVAAKANRPREVFVLLLANHWDLVMETDEGALFVLALALKIRAASSSEAFRDLLASRYGIYLGGRLPAVRPSGRS